MLERTHLFGARAAEYFRYRVPGVLCTRGDVLLTTAEARRGEGGDWDDNEYWSPKQAIRYVHAIEEEYDLAWVEEPVRRWDVAEHKKVSDGVCAAVATGENLDCSADYLPLLAVGAADILNIRARAGGITGAMKVADLAHAHEVRVTMMNCPANLTAHPGAVLPNHIMMEVLDNGRDAVLTHTHDIEDEWIVLNDEPGLDFTFDQEKLDAHAVRAHDGLFGWGRR